MARLSAAGDGWINLLPKIADDDDRPTALRFFTLFSGGGTGITMCSWIPGRDARGGRSESRVGITHVTGRRVKAELVELATPVPKDWFIEQDHPRRGLVLRVPDRAPLEEVLEWALRATQALSAPPAIQGWRADVYLPLPT